MAKKYEDLPDWLKELWDLKPSLARRAELYIEGVEKSTSVENFISRDNCGRAHKAILDMQKKQRNDIICDQCGNSMKNNGTPCQNKECSSYMEGRS